MNGYSLPVFFLALKTQIKQNLVGTKPQANEKFFLVFGKVKQDCCWAFYTRFRGYGYKKILIRTQKGKYYYKTPSSFDGKEYKNEINVAEFRRLDEKRKMREKRLGAET